jgi:hypothetical protein
MTAYNLLLYSGFVIAIIGGISLLIGSLFETKNKYPDLVAPFIGVGLGLLLGAFIISNIGSSMRDHHYNHEYKKACITAGGYPTRDFDHPHHKRCVRFVPKENSA